MTSTRQLVDRIKHQVREEDDAPEVLIDVVELIGRAVIALEDLAHHFNTGTGTGAEPESPTPVYSHPGCVFNYCPHPELCRDRPSGCTQVPE